MEKLKEELNKRSLQVISNETGISVENFQDAIDWRVECNSISSITDAAVVVMNIPSDHQYRHSALHLLNEKCIEEFGKADNLDKVFAIEEKVDFIQKRLNVNIPVYTRVVSRRNKLIERLAEEEGDNVELAKLFPKAQPESEARKFICKKIYSNVQYNVRYLKKTK